MATAGWHPFPVPPSWAGDYPKTLRRLSKTIRDTQSVWEPDSAHDHIFRVLCDGNPHRVPDDFKAPECGAENGLPQQFQTIANRGNGCGLWRLLESDEGSQVQLIFPYLS